MLVGVEAGRSIARTDVIAGAKLVATGSRSHLLYNPRTAVQAQDSSDGDASDARSHAGRKCGGKRLGSPQLAMSFL